MTALLDMDKLCRVCMRGEQEMFLIFDEKYAEERSRSVADMLSECTRYKVERFDELPQQICGNCLTGVRQAFRFKRECEKSYRSLVALLISNESAVTKSLDDGAIIKVEAACHTEKSTQTDQPTMYPMYPCERCEQKFFNYDALKAHRDEEHRGSPIVCRFCAKTFNRIGYLKTHIAVFHPGTGYKSHNQCHICKRQFTRRQHMRRHMAVIHKIVDIVDDASEMKEVEEARNSAESIEALPVKLEVDAASVLETSKFQPAEAEAQNPDQVEYDIEDDACEDMHAEQSPASTTDSDDEKPLANLLLATPMNGFMEVLLHAAACDDELPECVEAMTKPSIKTESTITTTRKIRARDVLSPMKRGRGRPPRRAKEATCSTDDEQQYKCEACDEVFQERVSLQQHTLTHTQAARCSCKICGKRFASAKLLKHHLNSTHSAAKVMKCEQCDKIFTHISQYKRHKETKHSDKMYKCEICEKIFSTKIYLQRHMTIHDKKRYVCKECSQSYLTKEELNSHIKAEGHDKPMLCPECGLRCKTSNILMVHMRRHNGEKPFKCKFCSKGFPRTDDLRVHEKYHTGEKSHFCETCGKGFQRKYNLTIHLRVHTGEKPYKCPHCPQAFAQGNDLKAHIRRHTGERFRCEVCGAAFLQGYQIRQHKLMEHGIKENPPTQRVAKFTSPEEQEQQIRQNLQKELIVAPETNETVDTAVALQSADSAMESAISEFMNI